MHRTCEPRWETPRTHSRKTLGPLVANVAAQLGTPLMPWQRKYADVALEIQGPDEPEPGIFAYHECGLTVPRQSGKTSLILPGVVARGMLTPQYIFDYLGKFGMTKSNFRGRVKPFQVIAYTAQNGVYANKKFREDWVPMLCPDATRAYHPMVLGGHTIGHLSLGNGHEGMHFNTGSRMGLLAGTAISGHGSTLDLAIVDEAFAQKDWHIEQAIDPALTTRWAVAPGSQKWFVSTAGTPEESPFLWAKVEKYRALCEQGVNYGICYMEWSADDDLDPADESTWWSCMPALGITQTVEAIRARYESFMLEGKVNEFERAYLNRWKSGTLDPVISAQVWKSRERPRDDCQMLDPIVLTFDIAPSDRSSSIAACGRRADGKFVVEVIDQRPHCDWVPDRLRDLVSRHQPAAVVADERIGLSILPDLEQVGLHLRTEKARSELLVFTKGTDMVSACEMFFDAVQPHGEGRLVHLADQGLAVALDGAVKRELENGWAWSRKNSAVDITPLVACTLGVWGVNTQIQVDPPEVYDLAEIMARLQREKQGVHSTPVTDDDEVEEEAPQQSDEDGEFLGDFLEEFDLD